MGTNEQNQHFAELRQKVHMFVHTRSSATKRYAMFGWQTRTFCHKKVGKAIAKLEQISELAYYSLSGSSLAITFATFL